MYKIIFWDTRLEGTRPLGEDVKEVNENVPLDNVIAYIAMRCRTYSDVSVRILAHGVEPRTGFLTTGYGTVSRPQRRPDGTVAAPPSSPGLVAQYSQGGGGILFCREGIRLSTLSKFEPLKGKLKMIEILGCGAAYITPGYEGRDGDGNLLCFRLAQIAQTYVRASTATQEYDPDHVEFGKWEGTVITYSPSGGLAKIEHSPLE